MRALIFRFFTASAAMGVALTAAAQTAGLDATEPHPELKPEQVVSIQLAALKNNDEHDRGIRIAFNFASPANKASTGPIQRFILMVKNPLYRIMLNYQSAEREPIQVEGDAARQKVTLVDQAGNQASFVFVLSKQQNPPYENCWMTESVIRVGQEPGVKRVASSGKAGFHASGRRQPVRPMNHGRPRC